MTTDPITAALAAERHRRGLSMQKLADQLGRKTYQSIWQWENHSDVRLSNLREWAAALGYDLALIPREDTP